jgi:hypothetical protein
MGRTYRGPVKNDMRHNTEMTRRRFVTVLQAGVVLSVAGDCMAAETSGNTNNLLDKQRFAPLVGTAFQVFSPSGVRSSLTLREVQDITVPNQPAPQLECTLLRFSAQGRTLQEGTYRLVHSTAGEFRLHLSQGNSGHCLAFLTHVPAEYLTSISIPRKAPARIPEAQLSGTKSALTLT